MAEERWERQARAAAAVAARKAASGISPRYHMTPAPRPAYVRAPGRLAISIRAILEHASDFRAEGTGEVFRAITETDLAHFLRERGWRLPRGWMSEVEAEGFSVWSCYRCGPVRRFLSEAPRINPETGRPWAYDSHQRRLLDGNTTLIRDPAEPKRFAEKEV